MDANSIITQVSRDDEQLNAFTNEKGIYTHIRNKFLIFHTIYLINNKIKLVSSMNLFRKQ